MDNNIIQQEIRIASMNDLIHAPRDEEEEYDPNVDGLGDYLYLVGADCRNAGLMGMLFRQSDFSSADFTGADLTNVEFNGCDLTKTNFTDAIMVGVKMVNCIASGAIFTGANLMEAYIVTTMFDNATFEDANIKGLRPVETYNMLYELTKSATEYVLKGGYRRRRTKHKRTCRKKYKIKTNTKRRRYHRK